MTTSLLTLFLFAATVQSDPLADTTRRALDKIAPSLVRIEITGAQRTGLVTTGVIVAADGWIITSDHAFAQKPAGILVTTSTQTKLPARWIATDHRYRLALLKIDASSLPVPTGLSLRSVAPGQSAIAVGNVWDTPSLSLGIISAAGRIANRAIQTDAKVSPLNYGGPLLSLEGRVLGILTLLDPAGQGKASPNAWYDSGIGFAIPWDLIQEALPKLKQGDIQPGIAGLIFQDADLVLGSTLITHVPWRGPAWNAGLQKGDIVTAALGTPIERRVQLQHLLGNKTAGDSITLAIKRSANQKEVTLKLAAELPIYRWPHLGIAVNQVENTLVIDDLLPDSPAAKAGFTPGSIITSLNGAPLTTREQFQQAVALLAPTERVTLEVKTQANTRSVNLNLAEFPTKLPLRKSKSASSAKREERTPTSAQRPYIALVPTSSKPPGLLFTFAGPRGPNAKLLETRWQRPAADDNLVVIIVSAADPNNWSPDDERFATSALFDALKHYQPDPARIIIHGAYGSAPVADRFSVQMQSTAHGLLLIGGPSPRPIPLEPDTRRALFFLWPEKDPRSNQLTSGLANLTRLGWPVQAGPRPLLPGVYPNDDIIDECARWTLLFNFQ